MNDELTFSISELPRFCHVCLQGAAKATGSTLTSSESWFVRNDYSVGVADSLRIG
jgi:hypothetical protein